MIKPSLPEIIKKLSRYDAIVMVPQFQERVHLENFHGEMNYLAERFGLAYHFKGAGSSTNFERARREQAGNFLDNRYREYHVFFDELRAALLFLRKVNDDLSIRYSAEVPTQPVGSATLTPVVRIS